MCNPIYLRGTGVSSGQREGPSFPLGTDTSLQIGAPSRPEGVRVCDILGHRTRTGDYVTPRSVCRSDLDGGGCARSRSWTHACRANLFYATRVGCLALPAKPLFQIDPNKSSRVCPCFRHPAVPSARCGVYSRSLCSKVNPILYTTSVKNTIRRLHPIVCPSKIGP